MKIWLLKSLNDFLFLAINTLLFFNSVRFSSANNAKTYPYTELKNNILGSDAHVENKISDKIPNQEKNFDFALQKSTIKKPKSTVGDLIHINFEKNKKRAIARKHGKSPSLEQKVAPIEKNNIKNLSGVEEKIKIKTEKNDVELENNKKKETEKNQQGDKAKKQSFFSALFDSNKSLNVKGGFFNEFGTSFSLNFFSEIGDKSFIAVFLFTNQASWVTLFVVASVTEILFNLLSVAIGYNLRAYESIYFILIYITIFTTLLFGFLLLKEAIYDEDEEEQQEIENANSAERQTENATDCEKGLGEKKNKTEEQKSFFFLIFKIFWVVLLSELGDKSQIVTIMLSTHHNPLPVFLGTAIAHVLGVLLSILLGSLVTSRISKKIMNYIAAACFIGYGLYVSISYFFDKKTVL